MLLLLERVPPFPFINLIPTPPFSLFPSHEIPLSPFLRFVFLLSTFTQYRFLSCLWPRERVLPATGGKSPLLRSLPLRRKEMRKSLLLNWIIPRVRKGFVTSIVSVLLFLTFGTTLITIFQWWPIAIHTLRRIGFGYSWSKESPMCLGHRCQAPSVDIALCNPYDSNPRSPMTLEL